MEDDPELRQNVALHRDEDVMADLEAQVANMGLDDKPSKQAAGLTEGSVKVAGEFR